MVVDIYYNNITSTNRATNNEQTNRHIFEAGKHFCFLIIAIHLFVRFHLNEKLINLRLFWPMQEYVYYAICDTEMRMVQVFSIIAVERRNDCVFFCGKSCLSQANDDNIVLLCALSP